MNKAMNMLGLAMRAGRLVTGEEAVLAAIRSGAAKLVWLSEDAAGNTKKRVTDKCNHYRVPLIQASDRHELGHAVGKSERVVVAVTDEGFARSLTKLVSESRG
ncbi:YlxQ family RNA-binding protein [Staphylospora marina]|uniref:YlxQ family RNA-binding protein n=1 Tax=Staphylospora marina TaxID=2490858 RepID=UPI000F5C05D8|nr:YlxQ family RNA-binding protein [Staphylospora marina]